MKAAKMFLHIVPIDGEDRVKIRIEVVQKETGWRLESLWDCSIDAYEKSTHALEKSVRELVEKNWGCSLDRVSIKDFVNFSYESREIGNHIF